MIERDEKTGHHRLILSFDIPDEVSSEVVGEAIGRLYAALDAYHMALGGHGLVLKDWSIREADESEDGDPLSGEEAARQLNVSADRVESKAAELEAKADMSSYPDSVRERARVLHQLADAIRGMASLGGGNDGGDGIEEDVP